MNPGTPEKKSVEGEGESGEEGRGSGRWERGRWRGRAKGGGLRLILYVIKSCR